MNNRLMELRARRTAEQKRRSEEAVRRIAEELQFLLDNSKSGGMFALEKKNKETSNAPEERDQ